MEVLKASEVAALAAALRAAPVDQRLVSLPPWMQEEAFDGRMPPPASPCVLAPSGQRLILSPNAQACPSTLPPCSPPGALQYAIHEDP